MAHHVAIIMDGNGRWAKKRLMPRTMGHRKGAEAARSVIEACPKLGVKILTLYAFSSENWQRPQDEVTELMQLLRHYLGKELQNLHQNKVRLCFIGNRDYLEEDIQQQLLAAEKLTQANDGLILQVALSYGSRDEMLRAVRDYAADVQAGKVAPDQLSAAKFETYLDTAGIADPDLLIRTGGEQRLSNFLLWQSAYTELYFTEILWPDFDMACLEAALAEYAKRERRFGRTEQVGEAVNVTTIHAEQV